MILSTFFIIIAYLMGSICSAVIVCQTFSLPDPRTEGSQNPGATNVLRIAGKKYAILVLVADMLKGTIPVFIARLFLSDPMVLGFVALAAVIGHMYPLFFDFKGGKGVATAIGALFGFEFLVGVMVSATWLVVARFTRYSSLASIISICLSPFYALLIIGRIDVDPPLFLMAVLILIKHKNNIGRLIEKTEPKIKLKQHSVLEEVMDEGSSDTVSMPNSDEPLTPEMIATPPEDKAPVAKKTRKPTTKKPKINAGESEAKAKPAPKTAAKKPRATKPKTEE